MSEERNKDMSILIKMRDVQLIMRSHRVSQDEAVTILKQLATGERQAPTSEKLCKMAGVAPKGFASWYQPTTKALSRVDEQGVSRGQPPRARGNRHNGRKPQLGDATARGLER